MTVVYLDYASSSPVDPRVLSYAGKYLTDDFGNASTLHSFGLKGKEALEEARIRVARLVNAEDPSTIIFTGCATEANNLAIRGGGLRNRKMGTRVLSSAIEHISVQNPMKELQKAGFEFAQVPVDTMGIVDLSALEEKLDSETVLTSINFANDEIGTIQPIGEISRIVHEKGHLLHVNATAAAGKIPVDVQGDDIDLLTLSSNEIYGPRGAAALYIKKGVKIQTILPGGGQERGLRSGTENIFAIAGMGEAARLAGEEMNAESARLAKVRDGLIEEILTIEESFLTGHPTQRLPGHASFRFSRIEGESILLNLDMLFDIQVATGSACTSRTLEASPTLLAIGLKHEEAHGSVVMTLGRSNTMDDIPVVAEGMRDTVKRLRDISPL
ncbi:MAG TPA: cysteine desulfurase family protein [Methanoregulaceae archaeon]|nr:cysteine desulfurase family protein [Methanoregulaceae archaeon]